MYNGSTRKGRTSAVAPLYTSREVSARRHREVFLKASPKNAPNIDDDASVSSASPNAAPTLAAKSTSTHDTAVRATSLIASRSPGKREAKMWKRSHQRVKGVDGFNLGGVSWNAGVTFRLTTSTASPVMPCPQSRSHA